MKKYKVIYADPPWHQRGGGKSTRGAQNHYSIMKEADITALMKSYLTDRTEDDAHLYMWVANNHLEEGLRIINKLGFRYITNIVWSKPSFGIGRYFRGQHEICLFATKGRGWSVRRPPNGISTLLGEGFLPKRKHSQKPDEMYDLIEERSYGPYLEMFARTTRDGWDSWGNEIKEEEDE